MKRLLAFLILFALLLGVLLWFDSRSAGVRTPSAPAVEGDGRPSEARAPGGEPRVNPAPQVEPSPQAAANGQSGTEASGDAGSSQGFVPVTAAGQVETQVLVSGPIDFVDKTEVSPGRFEAHSHVRSEDTVPLGNGNYELRQALVEYFDPTTSTLLRDMRASNWTTRLKSTTAGLEFDSNFENVLRDVRVTLLEDPRFAPLKLEVAELKGKESERRFTSDSRVTAKGNGLTVEGQGLLLAAGPAQELTITKDVTAVVDFPDGTKARFACQGSWSLLPRDDLGPQGAEIVARDSARLTWSSGEELTLEADLVRIEGRVPEAGGGFIPRTASAEGHVQWSMPGNEFQGERARMDFDDQGRLQSGRIEGRPSGRIQLDGVALPQDLGGKPPKDGGKLNLRLAGEGPLDLLFGEKADLDLVGPATVNVEEFGLVLEAAGRIKAERTLQGAGFAALEALGGAHLKRTAKDAPATQLQPELTTRDLRLEYLLPAEGAEPNETTLRMRARGTTHMQALGPASEPMQLDAQGGLVATQKGALLEVQEALAVDVAVQGSRPWRARAGRVENLNAQDATFVAKEGVEIEAGGVTAVGQELQALGERHFTLRGTSDRLARVDLAGGFLEAGWIDAFPEGLFAQDGVRLSATGEDMQLEVAARWLALDRRSSESAEPQAPAQPSSAATVSPRPLTIDVGGDVRVHWKDALREIRWSSDFARVRADQLGLTADAGIDALPTSIEPKLVEGLGQVSFEVRGETQIAGTCGRLRVEEQTALADPSAQEQIHVWGKIPGRESQFDMRAGPTRFGNGELWAQDASVTVDGVILPFGTAGQEGKPANLRARGQRLFASAQSLLLVGEAQLGHDGNDELDSWSIDAQRLQLSGSFAEATSGETPPAELSAWDGFTARVGQGVQIKGERLHGDTRTTLLDVLGSPATVSTPDFSWKSDWFEYDALHSSLRSGHGELTTTSAETGETWRMQYSSLQPVAHLDATIQVFREPVFLKGTNRLRASWALFWVDSRQWDLLAKSSFGGAMKRAPSPDEELSKKAKQRRRKRQSQNLFGALDNVWVADWLQELYLDGNIEYEVEGKRLFRCEALYLDMIGSQAWLRDVDMTVRAPFDDEDQGQNASLKLKASWLRHSADGSLRASNALATTCDHDQPHYVVRIGDLSLNPRTKERARRPNEPGTSETVRVPDGWDTTLAGMSIVLWGDAQIPLPKTSFPLSLDSDKLSPKIRGKELSVFGLQPLSIGSSAKLGNFIGLRFRNELGWVGKGVHKWLTAGKTSLPERATVDYSARFTNSRGIPLGVEAEVSDESSYAVKISADGLFDRGEDKGLLRVPSDERDDWRGWYRLRGRKKLGPEEWVDLVISRQTDAGVQAEFFESDFLRFEERESYLHWRRAQGDVYTWATAEAYLEDFRSEVVESPAVGIYNGRSVLTTTLGLPLVYSSNTSVAHLDRYNGTFEDPFPDVPGLPNPPDSRSVLRFDSSHRFELPSNLGIAGLRAVPYLEGRLSAWDRSALDDDQQGRFAPLAGVEFTTSIWKRFESGTLHTLSPFIGVRRDLGIQQSDGELVQYDTVEEPLDGKFLDLGLRSRMDTPGQAGFLDFELRQTYADDVAEDVEDGWQATRTRATWLSQVGGVPFAISHDGRYEFDDHLTPYSRSILSFDPVDELGLELGYHSARDLEGESLYNALSLGARYELSPKWHLEGRYTYSTQGDGRLASNFMLRRLGHDFIIEMDTGFTAGEGSSGFGFTFIPRTLWRRDGATLLERWLARPD